MKFLYTTLSISTLALLTIIRSYGDTLSLEPLAESPLKIVGFKQGNDGIEFQVIGRGCTHKYDFLAFTSGSNPTQIELQRINWEYCWATPRIVSIAYDYEELGLVDGAKFQVSNDFIIADTSWVTEDDTHTPEYLQRDIEHIHQSIRKFSQENRTCRNDFACKARGFDINSCGGYNEYTVYSEASSPLWGNETLINIRLASKLKQNWFDLTGGDDACLSVTIPSDNEVNCIENRCEVTDHFPTCEYDESDEDGDGWGWENNQSCRVRLESKKRYPDCYQSDSDPDGDGWGWENEQSCRVREPRTSV